MSSRAGANRWLRTALVLCWILAGCSDGAKAEQSADRSNTEPVQTSKKTTKPNAATEPNEERTAELISKLLPRPKGEHATRDLYLNLMKLSLSDLIHEDDQKARRQRLEGLDWPGRGFTMIGLRRLNNLQECFVRAVENDVPGDMIETGAWRGGATIFMRALLEAYDIRDRTVWVADSFEGMPKPSHPEDTFDFTVYNEDLAVSIEEVKRNFTRYGLLDDQVVMLKGWFKDTLPTAPIEKLAILRLDGDLYQSTMDSLVNLYPKLSSGGCLIVDDYALAPCRKAVADYRREHGITEPIVPIDLFGVYWIKK